MLARAEAAGCAWHDLTAPVSELAEAVRATLVAGEPAAVLALAQAAVERSRLAGSVAPGALRLAGNALLRLGDLPGALRYAHEAVGVARFQSDERELLAALHLRSRLLGLLGERVQAQVDIEAALPLARLTGDLALEGNLLGALGYLYAQRDQPEPYERYTRDALRVFRLVGDRHRIANCLFNIAGALARRGKIEEAQALYEEALPHALAIRWRWGEALHLAGLGELECLRGRFEAGDALYRQSIELLRDLGETFQEARHWLLLGRALAQGDRHVDARAPLERAVDLAEAHGFRGTLSEAYDHLAAVLERTGDAAGAIRVLRSRLTVQRRLDEEEASQRMTVAELRLQADASARAAVAERERRAELEAANAELRAALEREGALLREVQRAARTDPDTGLPNRRHAEELASYELARARRSGRPLAFALVVLHPDDTAPREEGSADGVLRAAAARLGDAVGSRDRVARWSAEELCVLVPGAEDGEDLVRVLRGAVEGSPVRIGGEERLVTVSVGLASAVDGSLTELVASASTALRLGL